jgi:hypothetical protein
MRIFLQIVSVLFIAIGVGLLVAGRSAQPAFGVDSSGDPMRAQAWSAHNAEFYVTLAVVLKGTGAGFLTLGILGLLVPWANTLIYNRRTTPDQVYSPP